MRTWLVTGGAGFIGSWLVERLLAAGDSVRVLDDFSTGTPDNLPQHDGLRIIEGDICDTGLVASHMAACDGCFHLAAVASVVRSFEDWAETHRVNALGTVTVLEQALRAGIPVVAASSAAVYGIPTAVPQEEDAQVDPLSPYGLDKLTGERHAQLMAGHGLKACAMRFFNVYGPRQDPKSPYSGVISIFADRALQGRPLVIDGAGDQTRDFIYVTDVTAALVLAMRFLMQAGTGGRFEVFNVCGGTETSISTLAAAVIAATESPADIEYGPARTGDIPRSLGAPAKAAARLGFRADTSLEQGLRSLAAALAGAA